jgi:Activator of Hsp90 ATPase homolog 1-like protein
MLMSSEETGIKKLEVVRDIEVAAPIDIVFETILEQLGPLNEGADREPIPMKLEPWPGGRWFRDFGNNAGHFWGHVQSFRPHDLLEIHGPMFMSAPVISHVLYRLKEENGVTRIKFSHRAIGQIPEAHLDGTAVNRGWTNHFARVKARAEGRK